MIMLFMLYNTHNNSLKGLAHDTRKEGDNMTKLYDGLKEGLQEIIDLQEGKDTGAVMEISAAEYLAMKRGNHTLKQQLAEREKDITQLKEMIVEYQGDNAGLAKECERLREFLRMLYLHCHGMTIDRIESEIEQALNETNKEE